ncbi:MAG: MFS transporter [Pseudomonadota bacterium]
MPRDKVIVKSPFFYGWYVLTASFFILFLYSGARFAIGVAFKPMLAEFGWNRSAISLAYFLNMTCYALTISFVGRWYDRYGPKWVIIITTLFLFTGCASLSFITAYWQFLVAYGILFGVGLGGPSTSLFASLASKWFDKGRGMAVSIGISGSCIGQFALVPFFTLLVLHYGWGASYFWIGLSMLVVNVPLALWVIKGNPADLGLRPFGSGEVEKGEDPRVNSVNHVESRDLGIRDAMRTGSYWFLVVMMFICGSGDFFVTTHLIPYVTDHGISPTTAGHMLAWFGLMSFGGVIVAGPVSDRIGNRIPIALTFVIRIFLFLMVLMYQNSISFYVFALVFGFTFFISAALAPVMIGRLYGLSHVGILSGVATTVHHFGGGFWTFVGGWLFDQTGSYRATFILSAVTSLVALLCTLLIKEKRHQAR